MKVTVLLDNYNYERFIGRALDSVLAQSYREFELIIVDDGSTDNSRSIIAACRDARIITIFKENGGQASAFRAGMARRTGEYIAFLDSDDVWDPNKLAVCIQTLRAQPDIVLLNHSYRKVNDVGDLIGELVRFQTVGNYDLLSDIRQYDTRLSFVPTSFLVGRRKECLQLDFDETEWRIAADTPIAIGLALRGRTYNLPELLGSYRIHSANLWANHVNEEFLFHHFQRVYHLVNQEMRRMGSSELFDFSKTELAMNRQVLKSSKYTVNGIYHRLRKRHFLKQSTSV